MEAWRPSTKPPRDSSRATPICGTRALRDITTRLNVFDRSIEIINPRRSNGFAPAALKAIRYGMPQRLNAQVAAIFSSPAYGLTLPSGGLPMLLREARRF